MEKRILVVDDDAGFREVFARALRRALAAERFDVAFVGAGSISEARAQLREGGLDAFGAHLEVKRRLIASDERGGPELADWFARAVS
jgi:CheY-like chemotaxis protein